MKKMIGISIIIMLLISGCSSNIMTLEGYYEYINENDILDKVDSIESSEEVFEDLNFDEDTFIEISKEVFDKESGIIKELKEKIDSLETTNNEVAEINTLLINYIEKKGEVVDLNNKIYEKYKVLIESNDEEVIKDNYKSLLILINDAHTINTDASLFLDQWQSKLNKK